MFKLIARDLVLMVLCGAAILCAVAAVSWVFDFG
jgi:hypothetical protein